MPVRAGSLNRSLTLEKRTFTEDDLNGQIETWETVVDPYWCRFKNTGGSQQFEGGQRFTANRVVVEGRYISGIAAATHRLKYGDRILRIEAIVNPEERNETLEFVCEESPAVPEKQA